MTCVKVVCFCVELALEKARHFLSGFDINVARFEALPLQDLIRSCNARASVYIGCYIVLEGVLPMQLCILSIIVFGTIRTRNGASL